MWRGRYPPPVLMTSGVTASSFFGNPRPGDGSRTRSATECPGHRRAAILQSCCGIDLNKPRIRAALAAALALAAAPHGCTVAERAARVQQFTGQPGYAVRQAAYENLRIGMQTLFHHLGITPAAAAAA